MVFHEIPHDPGSTNGIRFKWVPVAVESIAVYNFSIISIEIEATFYFYLMLFKVLICVIKLIKDKY